MVQEKKRRNRKALTVMILVCLALLSAANLRIIKDPIQRFARHDISFRDFVSSIQEGYLSDDFSYKNNFLNLNGLFARLTGRRTLNNVVKLNNGMLGQTLDEEDITDLANGIVAFSDYLNEQGVPFLYIQMPYKESLDGQSYPEGITSYANTNADNLILYLSLNEVKILDLRPLLCQTQNVLEKYFSKTDHHWNNDGSFVAFQEILSCLHEFFPTDNIDMTYAQVDQWERHTINDWTLGSMGKRVGIFFGGTDPLIWYTPKFETQMSRIIPSEGSFFRGNFIDANIVMRYIEEKDYFGLHAYLVYCGDNYPLVQHRNPYAPSPLKIMIIKDSFSLPLEAYLSTIFQEIDVIDPRVFSKCTFAEYVEWTNPDIVIFGIHPGVFGDRSYQNFGVEEEISAEAVKSFYESVICQDIVVETDDNNHNYIAYPLESDTVYRISFDDVDIFEGQIEGVGLQLYDVTTETVLENAIFDLAYCKATDNFSWVFRTLDIQDEFELRFYAGIYDSTLENKVVYRNVALERLQNNNA